MQFKFIFVSVSVILLTLDAGSASSICSHGIWSWKILPADGRIRLPTTALRTLLFSFSVRVLPLEVLWSLKLVFVFEVLPLVSVLLFVEWSLVGEGDCWGHVHVVLGLTANILNFYGLRKQDIRHYFTYLRGSNITTFTLPHISHNQFCCYRHYIYL